MSRIVIMILVLVIIISVAIIAVKKKIREKTMGKKKSGARVEDLQVDAVEMKRKKESIQEDPEVLLAKKELYQYLTQIIKKMFLYYRRGDWDHLTKVNVPPEQVFDQYDKIRQSLTPQSARILDDCFSCIDIKGSEESRPGTVKDSEQLKKVFLNMVLPFYPVYYDKLDGIRYTSLLNQTMLNMFHRLTGKKFRLGYKNRYPSGVTAYRWEGERYQVYEEDGTLLCDAVFRDGKVWSGYARIPKDGQSETEDWTVIQAGTFKEGIFFDGILQYIYGKKCGQL